MVAQPKIEGKLTKRFKSGASRPAANPQRPAIGGHFSN
jgi:hypothetical protein